MGCEKKGEANKKPKNRLDTHKRKRERETIIIADKDICDAALLAAVSSYRVILSAEAERKLQGRRIKFAQTRR